ncbi:44411_t:CDS:1, partial [Gigaspora margarita]
TATVYILIRHSTTMLGNVLEWDALSELKSISFIRREKLDDLTWIGMEYVHTG